STNLLYGKALEIRQRKMEGINNEALATNILPKDLKFFSDYLGHGHGTDVVEY
ncbi:hypothetical protein HAX54_009627, partial [Datura stramonium]|nr:hypothetical protein [Datura stramonium]